MLTPCIGICRLKDRVCIGCGRSVVEIQEWRDYSDERRLEIIERLKLKDNKNGREE